MDGRAQVKEQSWLNPENLVIFIDELKDAGFNIGVSQYIAAQDLVLALVAQGNNLDHQHFKNMLGSLLCSSPKEQEDFRRRFDQWVHRMGVAIATEENQANEKARKLERELINIRKQSKKWKKIWLFVIGIFIVLVVGVSINYFSSLPNEPVDPTQQVKPVDPNQQETPTDLETSLNSTQQETPVEPKTPVDSTPTNIKWKILLGALLIILVTFIIWRWWWWKQANLFLKRNATTEEPKLQKISIADNDKELFPDLLYLKIAQQFRKRIRVESSEIDVEKSFEKTLDSGVWFTPVYKSCQIPPEYLFLVDRTSYGDLQARFITEMIDRLVHNGVFINGYFFDNDPRISFPMSGQKYSCRLAELAAKYSEHRLVVFSEAERLFSPVTGELESWVEIFAKWQDRAMLTPKPMENWGFEEIELAEQFMILPATSEGLLSFIKNLEIESSTLVLTRKEKPPVPESLQERPLYWIDREPPEDYLIEEVLPSLKLYLGQDGYHWLSACAVFPELHWNLTLYLGNALKNQEGETLLQSCNLSDIARLPWFRYGYMPDWLRLLLIADLSPEQDRDIREKLDQLLVSAVSGSVSGMQLEIAEDYSNYVSKITKPLLKLFDNKLSKNSPLRDYIFQKFMISKNENLAVKLPRKLVFTSNKMAKWLQGLLYILFVKNKLIVIFLSIITLIVIGYNFPIQNSSNQSYDLVNQTALQHLVKQPALQNINIPQAIEESGSNPVKIAILADGVSPYLIEVLGDRILEGKSFISGETIINSENDHGTLVSSIVAAIAPKATILPVKVIANSGSGADGGILDGIEYAIEEKADILLMPFGVRTGDSLSPIFESLFQKAQEANSLSISKAGDNTYSQQFPKFRPASSPNVLAVAATDNQGQLADFSNYGEWVSLAVPGVNITSIGLDGKPQSISGSSYSAAIAAGVAALMLSVNPDLTPDEIEKILQETSTNKSELQQKIASGQIDALAAVKKAKNYK